MHHIGESRRAGEESRVTVPKRPAEERGVVIIWALLTTFIVAGIVLTATERINAIDALADFEFSAHGQSEEITQAGLVDALAWYRSQPKQPVTEFMPKGPPPSMRATAQQAAGTASTFDVEAELASAEYYSLELRESEAPEKGLVRSFLMAPGIWARYTVARTDPLDGRRRAIFTRDDPGVWQPNGFEVKVVGRSGSRQVWMHIVVEVQATTGMTSAHASTLIMSTKDL